MCVGVMMDADMFGDLDLNPEPVCKEILAACDHLNVFVLC